MQIEEVILYTSSLPRTRLFYSRTLELPIVAESEEGVTFRAGASLLTFKPTAEGKPYYHIAFNITNNHFSNSFDWIDAKLDILPANEQMPIAVYEEWNAQSFYFYDNNGSILEFIARFDLPYESGEAFSVNDIREISEVGVVATNVTATAARLTEEQDLPVFAKSAPSAHFAALGDDHGLFIVVPVGHQWVPTHKPARQFPLTVFTNGRQVNLF